MKSLYEQLEEMVFEFANEFGDRILMDRGVAEKGRVTIFIGRAANTYADIDDVCRGVEVVMSNRYKSWSGDCRYLPESADLERIIAQEEAALKMDPANLPEYPVEPVGYLDSYCATNNKREDYGLDYFGRKCVRKYRLESFVGEGGDSMRDGSEGKVCFGKDLIAGSWKLEK